MILHNLRLGLATNSSSTHSLVFLPEGEGVPDDYNPGEFGWDFFTVTSKQGKEEYLGILLYQSLLRKLPPNIAATVCREWLGHAPDPEGYIDHQSFITLPKDPRSGIVDEEFFGEMKEFFLRDGLAILGGNDNSEADHPLAIGDFTFPVPYEVMDDRLVCRKDPLGYWALMDRSNGTKFRISFEDGAKPSRTKPEKATAPELVDVKITDYCPFGCPFCYQGSTPQGGHAGLSEIFWLSRALGDLRVFEVALGGGEPTMHPEFVTVLQTFRDNGVVPNFTTKSLDWLRNPKVWPSATEACGAFAYSVQKESDVDELAALLKVNGVDKKKASIQVIDRMHGMYELVRIMEAAKKCGFRVTVLGYKDAGRGAGFREDEKKRRELERNKGAWIEAYKHMKKLDMGTPYIGVDTLVASEYEEQIKAEGVPSYLYSVKEGKFSCYIDLVGNKIAPSSYCDEGQMAEFKPGYGSWSERIVEEFAKF